MLVIASSAEPAPSGGVQRFFVAAGAPATSRVLPEPAAPDVAAISVAAAAHGIELVAPT